MPSVGKEKLDSLLLELDKTLDNVAEYDRQKEQRLVELKRRLSENISSEETHPIYLQLYREYEAFVFDSAMYYAKVHLNLAEEKKDTYWINECKMQLAKMYSTFARFMEARDLLKSIPKEELSPQQLGDYYNRFAEVYAYWSEYTTEDDACNFIALKNTYLDSVLMVLPKGTYSYDVNYGRKCIDLNDFSQAEKILLSCLSQVKPDTRDYAMHTSLIANLYEVQGDEAKQVEFLAESAITDVKVSVKENIAIRMLAFYLLKNGDINRSNRYIKKSLEDANFYNARLRNVQIARILPIIDKTYELERKKHQQNLQIAIFVIGILSLFLIEIVVYLFNQMKNLSRTRKELIKANNNLKKVNVRLSETNHIKEEYIGQFLNQCSIYIDKLESYRKSLNKKASNGKLEELYQMLKSSQIMEDELKEFYQNFDTTFLNLFPNFVDEFNKLMPEEDRIIPPNKSDLSIELRIFALIRLGITDSTKIAKFLRYSNSTIYNYRSKYRSKSLVPREKFEETIMKIGYNQ
jgi:hypothetical protein